MRYCDGIGHIYCICCLANGKLYIGQTVKSIEKRFKEHKQAAKRGVPYRLYSAMRKYGVENFTIEEIIQVSAPNRQALKAKLCYIEERLIKRLQTKEFGYNSTDGGDGAVGTVWTEERRAKAREAAKIHFAKYWGHKHSEESRRKISESNKGRLPSMKGKHLSEEAKQKISKANSGHIGAFRGETLSKEHRRKISESKKGVKRKEFSDEWKKKLSESHKGEKIISLERNIPRKQERKCLKRKGGIVMRYWYRDHDWWYIGFSYDPALVASVKKFAGAGYNPQNREWYIPFSLVTVNPLKKWLEENGFKEGMNYVPSRRVIDYEEPEEVITAEEVEQACKEIGMKRIPRPYQCEGVAYMINHGNCINGDDCGLGKTAQTIIIIELLGAFPALIVTPASVKYNWKKEWAKWMPDRKVGVIERKRKFDPAVWDSDVVIINYDVLGERNMEKPTAKFKELLKKYWGACALDEIHFLKSEKALRTKMAKKITKRIEHVWGLTGTLTQNKPADLIQPFKIIRRFDDIFGDTLEFKFRYCNGKQTAYGFDDSGFSNLEELHELLRMGGYIRRNKRDVLEELPPLVEQTVDVPIVNLKEYRRAESDLLAYLEKIDIEKANNAVNAPHLVMINTLKSLSVKGKLPFMQSYIKDWLEANEDEQLVVFGVHREPLQELAKYFKAPIIQGGVSADKKQQIVNEFSQRKHRLLFANIQSAGTGTDGLQDNCSNLFYIELPDKSTDLEQTNSRLERMGQKNSINITYLLSPDTIDVEMRETVKDKSLITGVVNRGQSENELLARKFLQKHLK